MSNLTPGGSIVSALPAFGELAVHAADQAFFGGWAGRLTQFTAAGIAAILVLDAPGATLPVVPPPAPPPAAPAAHRSHRARCRMRRRRRRHMPQGA